MGESLEGIKGLGAKRIEALRKVGITTPEQLINYFPSKYIDYTNVKRIADCYMGEDAVLKVCLSGKVSQAHVNGRTLTRAVLCDESGKITATWFRQPWVFKQLNDMEGPFTVYGRVDRHNGKLCLNSPRIVTDLRITAEYKPIEAIPQKTLRELIHSALALIEPSETLPESMLKQYNLLPRVRALYEIHAPSEKSALERALYRMHFEDMLYFMVNAFGMRQYRKNGIRIPIQEDTLKAFTEALSFPLTNAQERVIREIEADLSADTPMARLVQGDVGSGKTAVAFAAIYECVCAGYQCAMMAPTEILAQQHFESAQKLLGSLNVRCALLTGSMSVKEHKRVLAELADGTIQAIFGTHALVSPNVQYKNLGLAVTDEQHRFGVRQRTRLGEKGDNPNVLVMSATPIPRTIALILYGDLDISVIDELPPGRIRVKTRLVPENKRSDMYKFILSEAAKGRQAYFVCPLVEDSEAVEAESAQHLYEEMKSSELGSLSIALDYGKQNPEEKQRALDSFYSGETQVLVSTTVIEVGVNVPNATVMVVENAARFGLSQLHQLRGRVGRGTEEAWCFLMANATEKLKILTKTNDGFEIAQKDLELRGPGDLFGTRQTGAFAGIDVRAAEDSQLLQLTNDLAKQIQKREDVQAFQIKENASKWLSERTNVIFAAN
ncbi:MAG: ATP-dependent DNA helicase RecG [Clostridia bacterium]|nr:ATP-dependent DNA helicase RecG [Clostridia bacterium]